MAAIRPGAPAGDQRALASGATRLPGLPGLAWGSSGARFAAGATLAGLTTGAGRAALAAVAAASPGASIAAASPGAPGAALPAGSASTPGASVVGHRSAFPRAAQCCSARIKLPDGGHL